MRRLIGRRGKGGGHGRIAGGWIDLARVAEGERPRRQREIAARLARELRKKPGKAGAGRARPGRARRAEGVRGGALRRS